MYSDYENPLYLITTSSRSSKNSGRIINWIIPFSLDQGIREFVICLANSGETYEAICESKRVALHLLSVDNLNLVFPFGYKKSSDFNKFEKTEFDMIDNLPIIKSVSNVSIFAVEEVNKGKFRSLLKLTLLRDIKEDSSIKKISIKDFYEVGEAFEVAKLQAKYEADKTRES